MSKSIRLLPNIPSVDLKLEYDRGKNQLILTGNKTPDEYVDEGKLAMQKIKNIEISINSNSFPQISIYDSSDSIILFIGGESKNPNHFKVTEHIAHNSPLLQIFNQLNLNKRIKIL